MNKRTALITVISIIVILLIILGIVFCKVRQKDKLVQENSNIEEDIDNMETILDEEIDLDKTYVQSTEKNKIEKDGVEATNIKIIHYESSLDIITTLKNNTSKDIKGFYIEIELLDKKGKEVTTIAQNSEDTIKAHGYFKLDNSVVGINNGKDIVKAKIRYLEKSTAEQFIDDQINGIQEQIPN